MTPYFDLPLTQGLEASLPFLPHQSNRCTLAITFGYASIRHRIAHPIGPGINEEQHFRQGNLEPLCMILPAVLVVFAMLFPAAAALEAELSLEQRFEPSY